MRKVLLLTMLSGLPILAQVNLSGEWAARQHEDQLERGPGPELGDYLGLPVNDAARLRGDSWNPSRITLPEEQCRVHIATYIIAARWRCGFGKRKTRIRRK